MAAGPWCVRRQLAGDGQLDVSPADEAAQRLDAGRADGAARRRATGDVPTPDSRITRLARPARRPRQRRRPLRRLVRGRLCRGDPPCHDRACAATTHRHRAWLVGGAMAAAARRCRRCSVRAGGEPAACGSRRQPGVHVHRVDDRHHRLVRRSDGSIAACRGRLERPGHRHPTARGTGDSRRAGHSAPKPESSAPTRSSARRSTISP